MAGASPLSANPHSGHRQRLRRRFLKAGLDGLSQHEIVELLLSYAVLRRDVKPLAKSLLEKFGSAASVMNATQEELTGEYGLGEASAALILLIKAMCAEYLEQPLRQRDMLANSDDVVNYLRMKLGGSRKETINVLYLNKRNYLIACDSYRGSVDCASIYPNEIAERALLCHASGVIMAHNHPSGVCTPSPEDMDATLLVQRALDAINIPLYEHLIVTPTGHFCLLHRTGRVSF